jgi:uncharacterized membrane protein
VEDPKTRAATAAEGGPPLEPGLVHGLVNAVRSRIFSGLLLALPVAITIWIVYWLYSTLQGLILNPLAQVVSRYAMRGSDFEQLPFWWDRFAAPAIAILLVGIALYFLGYLVHTRLARAIDWVLLRLPVVTTIYKAVSNVFHAIEDQGQGPRFKRVVLVEFPHPGLRALAFVTKTLRDADTDRTILCVCVLTGVMPPAGFTLYVPEEDVTDLDWTVNQTLQAILSGGITSPASIHYHHGTSTAVAGGPIVDTHGHPIEALRARDEAAEVAEDGGRVDPTAKDEVVGGP